MSDDAVRPGWPSEQRAEAAVSAAREELLQRWPDVVHTVIWYGAVDIDPAHLVVWVLLRGAESDVPAWFFASGDRAADTAAAGDRLDAMYAMAGVVRKSLQRVAWPNAEHADVGFDAEERVAREGFSYFR